MYNRTNIIEKSRKKNFALELIKYKGRDDGLTAYLAAIFSPFSRFQ